MRIPNTGDISDKERLGLYAFFCTWSLLIVSTVSFWVSMGPLIFMLPFIATIGLAFVFAYLLSRSSAEPLDKDTTIESYGMIVHHDAGRESYFGKFRPPRTCSQCGADISKKTIELVGTLTLKCPECKENIDCVGKDLSDYVMEGRP